MSDDVLRYYGTQYTVRGVYRYESSEPELDILVLWLSETRFPEPYVPANLPRDAPLVLRIDGVDFALSEGEVNETYGTVAWGTHNIDWSVDQVVSVELVEQTTVPAVPFLGMIPLAGLLWIGYIRARRRRFRES